MKLSRKNIGNFFKNLLLTQSNRSATRNRRFSPAMEQLERRDVPTVTYHGGGVLANVEVHSLYVGKSWDQGNTLATADMNNYLAHIVDSSYMDMLNANGYGVGRGQFVNDSTIDNLTDVPATITDGDIRTRLQAMIDNGNLGSPDANSLYFVFVEPSTEVIMSSGKNSINDFYGYHSAYWGTDGNGNSVEIPYAVMPYHDAVNAGIPGLSTFDSMTDAASHELAEAVTDPFPNTGWNDDAFGSQGEIGDLANHAQSNWDGYVVQQEVDQNGNLIDPNDYEVQTASATLDGPVGTTSDTTPTFAWNPVAGADHYDVYVSAADNTSKALLENQDVTGTSFTFSSALAPGQNYEYWVRAIDKAGHASRWSSADTFTVQALDAPTLTGPSSTSGAKATFQWQAVDGADHYEIWANDLTSGASQVVHNQNVTGDSYAANLTAGDSYQFWVRAVDGAGYGSAWSSGMSFSVQALAKPALTGPQGTVTSTTPTLTWNAVNGADHYEVWVSDLTTGAAPVVHNTTVKGTSLAATGLTAGNNYRFWVRAIDSTGAASDWSDSLDFKVAAVQSTTPTALGLANTMATPTITWTAATGADHYEVWINDLTTGASGVVDNAAVKGTTLATTGLTAGDSYRFWVRAFNSAGQGGAWSDSQDFTLAAVRVNTPTLTGATGTAGAKATLNWNAVTGANHYEVWVNDLTAGTFGLIDNQNATGTSLSVALKGSDNYRVWMRAFDSAGHASAWSKALDFAVAAVNLDAPSLGMPASNGSTVTFRWAAVGGADHYAIWVNDLTTGQSQVVYNPNVTTNVLTAQLTSGHRYRVWVRALDSAGNASDWRNALDFRVN